MPTGPKGQKRPVSSFQAAILTAKIATGELTEEDVKAKLSKKVKTR